MEIEKYSQFMEIKKYSSTNLISNVISACKIRELVADSYFGFPEESGFESARF